MRFRNTPNTICICSQISISAVHPKPQTFDHICKERINTLMEFFWKQVKVSSNFFSFTPDFPLLEEKIEQNDINSIIQWIQTIPLEYVPSVYSYLKSCNIHIPFSCPSLPSRSQISFRDRIQIRIFEKCPVC